MEGESRRDLLRRGLGVVAGAVGLGAIPTAATAAARPAPRELELKGSELRAHVHGRQAGRLPQPNDHLHVHGQVHDDGGRTAGTFTSIGLVLRSSLSDSAAVVEQHVFVLDGGTITGAGQRAGGAGVFAVTGGTGRYAGARGSYTATIDPAGIGGSGAATFDFVLSS